MVEVELTDFSATLESDDLVWRVTVIDGTHIQVENEATKNSDAYPYHRLILFNCDEADKLIPMIQAAIAVSKHNDAVIAQH